MNDLQAIFTVSYSILYGIMLNSCLGLGLYFWGWLGETRHWRVFDGTRRKVCYRLVISLTLINLLPFLIFAHIYVNLSSYMFACVNQVFGVFLLSLFVFAPYRALYAIIYRLRNDLYGRDIRDSNDIKRRLDGIGPVRGQIYGVVFYLACTIIGWWLITGFIT